MGKHRSVKRQATGRGTLPSNCMPHGQNCPWTRALRVHDKEAALLADSASMGNSEQHVLRPNIGVLCLPGIGMPV